MRFAEIVTNASSDGERVKITHYGKTIAVLISKHDLKRLQDCEAAREAKRGKDAGGADSEKPGTRGRKTVAGAVSNRR